MLWNWQHHDWPNFVWNSNRLVAAERRFLLSGGLFIGAIKHLGSNECNQLTVETISNEALKTSEIEGEILDRASVQSSVLRQFGLTTNKQRARPEEQGIAEMMVNLYHTFAQPLTEKTLFAWHKMVMSGQRDLKDIACYRTGKEPMQVISGKIDTPKVHFEAPPSSRLSYEMKRFIAWFNQTGSAGEEFLPALTRAGIAHLYFESIHPFEDGNGRIGRALAEKSLAQSLGQPTLIALASTILARRKDYYKALEAASKSMDITNWLSWFAGISLEAQQHTLALTEFLIEKTKLLDRLNGQLNDRQQKALLRVFREGPQGFKGGLSAGNYIKITGASPATATRDLVDMIKKGALVRIGEHRHARYHPNISLSTIKPVTINDQGEVIVE